MKTTIVYKGQKITRSLPVSKGTSLFGRDLMKAFKLDWNEIAAQCNAVSNVQTLTLKSVLSEFSDVFSSTESTGRIKNF